MSAFRVRFARCLPNCCFTIQDLSDSSFCLKLDLLSQPMALVLSPIANIQSSFFVLPSMMSIHIDVICAIYSNMFICALFLNSGGIWYVHALPFDANPPKPYSDTSQIYTMSGSLKVNKFMLTPWFTL